MTFNELEQMTPAQRFGAVHYAIRAQDWENVDVFTAFQKRDLRRWRLLGVASQSQHRRPPVSTDAHEATPLKPIEERAADFARAFGKR